MKPKKAVKKHHAHELFARVEASHDRVGGPVNHPRHYNASPSGVEAIVICEHLNFCLGNAVKYILRCDSKGAKIEDLKKSRWYLTREIERLEKENKS